jgi:hypothetical protein
VAGLQLSLLAHCRQRVYAAPAASWVFFFMDDTTCDHLLTVPVGSVFQNLGSN